MIWVYWFIFECGQIPVRVIHSIPFFNCPHLIDKQYNFAVGQLYKKDLRALLSSDLSYHYDILSINYKVYKTLVFTKWISSDYFNLTSPINTLYCSLLIWSLVDCGSDYCGTATRFRHCYRKVSPAFSIPTPLTY